MRRLLWTVTAVLIVSGLCLAQRGGGRSRRSWLDGGSYSPPEVILDRNGVPEWPRDPEFPRDDFTFVRVLFNSGGYRDKWATDYPDSDLNFSFRLQQLTSLSVNPDPLILDLTDPRLFDYPFLYIIEPGATTASGTGLNLSDEEIYGFRVLPTTAGS